MLKIKRIVAALLLTALIVADGAQLLGVSGNSGTDEFDQAGLFQLKAYWMKKDYNSEGVFTGCSGKGTNCLVFGFAHGDVSVSSEGVHMQ